MNTRGMQAIRVILRVGIVREEVDWEESFDELGPLRHLLNARSGLA